MGGSRRRFEERRFLGDGAVGVVLAVVVPVAAVEMGVVVLTAAETVEERSCEIHRRRRCRRRCYCSERLLEEKRKQAVAKKGNLLE